MKQFPISKQFRACLLEHNDFSLFRELFSRYEIMQYISAPYSSDQIEFLFKQALSLNEAIGFRQKIWTICNHDKTVAAGIAMLKIRNNVGEVGVMLKPDFWNMHIGRYAFIALVNLAEKRELATSMIAFCHSQNYRSLKTLREIGFAFDSKMAEEENTFLKGIRK
ncbi:GNAT family N-acetyltransferase [Alteromonas ponticola]|uniref:GNAT family N-acetyltransferase n=1 Tax=Alteromonas ponticola TaxID=2720613 RepID=A0ABX1R2I3_9ALTE|nr:GNAT family N-acetyltransferase [Alteromonas ponticola]NMH59443.1 GNAT family N-acetyltransferase [Alteromonas ponticola]